MGNIEEVRVRIAPSPTGDPHVGTAYVALFNYVFAKKAGGKFILRIEDTDRTRFRKNSEAMIMDSLNWLGLSWDEGPNTPGEYGPYRQSERSQIYLDHAQKLVDLGHAYHCFCTSERLNEVREKQKAAGLTTKYDRYCLSLSSEDVKRHLEDARTHVIRLKMPSEGTITFTDELRGQLEFNAQQLDDQVLIKSDGMPTYHLANVVDDHLMKISHVIRAEEWISSTPKHVNLYRAFGWQEPKWIHLPLLRNSDRSKISKRKNPVSLNYYRRAGILPYALRNFLGLMGWSFGNDQEIFTLDEMIDKFDIQNVSLGGPVFEIDKLTWLNQQYMHKMSKEEFSMYLRKEVFSDEFLQSLHAVALERMSRFEQFVDNNAFFFNGQLNYVGVDVVPKGRSNDELKAMLAKVAEKVDESDDWTEASVHELLENTRAELGWKPKDYFMPLRLVTTGRKDSPPLVESLVLIGREMVRFRLRDYISRA
jgi:glutamyl-tRNA synthetase